MCVCITALVHRQGASSQSGSVPHISTTEMAVLGHTNWLHTGPKKPAGLKPKTANSRVGVIMSFPHKAFNNNSKQNFFPHQSKILFLFTINKTRVLVFPTVQQFVSLHLCVCLHVFRQTVNVCVSGWDFSVTVSAIYIVTQVATSDYLCG